MAITFIYNGNCNLGSYSICSGAEDAEFCCIHVTAMELATNVRLLETLNLLGTSAQSKSPVELLSFYLSSMSSTDSRAKRVEEIIMSDDCELQILCTGDLYDKILSYKLN